MLGLVRFNYAYVRLRQFRCRLGQLPYTPGDAARVVDAYELVAGGSYVEVRLLLVYEERVRYPDVFDKLRPHGQRLYSRPLLERQPRVCPELSEVEVQGEVLTKGACIKKHLRIEVSTVLMACHISNQLSIVLLYFDSCKSF